MIIDMHFLVFFSVLISFIIAIVFSLQYFLIKSSYKIGFGYLALGSIFNLFGMIFVLIRDIPNLWIISIIGNNFSFILGALLIYIGIRKNYGQYSFKRWHYIYIYVFIGIIIYFTLVNNYLNVRMTINSVALGILHLIIVLELYKARHEFTKITSLFLAFLFTFYTAFDFTRAIHYLIKEEVQIFSTSNMQITTYFIYIISNILSTFGFILNLNQRLNEENNETKNNLENTKKDLITKEQELKNSIQEREKTLSTVNTDIATKREELKKLDNETSLIAYDMQEYVRNAKKDIKWYIGLSIIPWLLIACMSYVLVYGGAYLTTILKVENDAQLWTIFWSRIPFVLAVSSVMFVAYEVSNIFIRKIMEINQQILDFAKIGIIAKDVSETSSINLDLTDEEKFELRTKLKMDMLKSHLSKDLGKKFEINIKPKIWNKWLNLNDKSVDKDAKDTLDEE